MRMSKPDSELVLSRALMQYTLQAALGHQGPYSKEWEETSFPEDTMLHLGEQTWWVSLGSHSLLLTG